ncbi:hypothetical protein ACWFNE_06760 [Cellulomonas sp. NPDC055163]
MGEQDPPKRPSRRSEDHFAQRLEEVYGARRPPGPPPRRDPNAASIWLGRGKLWDDVFTRTLANVLSVGILAVAAAAAGLIQFDRQAWAIVILCGGVVLAVVIVNVAPVRYLLRQWWRPVIFLLIVGAAVAVSIRVSPLILPSGTGAGCDPLFALDC